MRTLIKMMIPLLVVASAGCVFVPARLYHAYYGYGPRVVVAPAPVVVVRP